MRKVELNMHQNYRYGLIKQLSDTKGNRLAVTLKKQIKRNTCIKIQCIH